MVSERMRKHAFNYPLQSLVIEHANYLEHYLFNDF